MFQSLRKFGAITAALLALFATGAQASGLLRAQGSYFVDPSGRKILLRGINLSNAAKVPPFEPISDLSELKRLHDLGFNNIRLLFIWEAFEPTMGQYNYAYLDELGRIVEAAGQLGMYTVLDFHMDGFSRYTVGGCGSGAPAWTVPGGGNVKPEDGQICRLWNFFETIEFINPWSSFDRALRAFYEPGSVVRDRYLAAWNAISAYFRKYPTLLGYDMLNEPWGMESSQIAPLYEDAAKAIRAQDPDAILFVEPGVLVALGWGGTSLPKPTFSNFAYAPHDYDAFALGFGVWLDFGLFINTNFDRITHQAKSWDVPIYLGEFGVAGSGGIALRSLLKHYYGLLDRHFTSSAQWDYSPTYTPQAGDGWNYENMSIIDQNGELRRNFIIRPYPAAVSGTPARIKVKYSDHASKRTFKFIWNNDPTEGSTDFFLPPALYTSASQVEWSTPNDDLKCAFDAQSSMLRCRSEIAGKKKIRIYGPEQD